MKTKFRFFLLIIAYASLMAMFIACQESKEEIVLPSVEQAFASDSELAELIQNIALLDGSSDNILDNASCLKVKLPLTVSLNGNEFLLSSDSDVRSLEETYDDQKAQDRVLLSYPISILTADYTEITVGSQEELDILANQCLEDGNDADIECVDFNYPITVYAYDILNQSGKNSRITSDKELFFYLKSLSQENLVSVGFPLNISTPESEVSPTDHQILKSLIQDAQGVCDEEDRRFYDGRNGGGGGSSFGTLSLFMTDAPFPLDLIEEANVTLTKIDIKTGEANDTVPFITLYEEEQTYNLIELTNGNTVDLGDNVLPAGTYQFLRMFVTDGSVVLKDGRVFDLKVPSGSQSGIKLKPATDLVVDENTVSTYLLDFDLSRSFVLKGNPNNIQGFNFKPVVKVSDLDESGTLTGSVVESVDNMSLANAQVSVFIADTLNTTTFTDVNGNYTLLGLDPGEYDITVELDEYVSQTVEEVEIERGETTQLDFVLDLE